MTTKTRRRRPLTKAVLRGLYVMVTLGGKDLEGEEERWVGPKGTFSDTSIKDLNAAGAWLLDARARKGMV